MLLREAPFSTTRLALAFLTLMLFLEGFLPRGPFTVQTVFMSGVEAKVEREMGGEEGE
jgi:hypothetical protein